MKKLGFILLAVSIPVQAATIHVSKFGDGTDGSSWESAFVAIGNAIEAALSGDHIWVASGTYNESIEMVTGVSLYGGFVGTETDEEFEQRNWQSNETTIDATGLDTSVVVAANEATLDGFTITGGYAAAGAGVLCLGTSLTIENCVIEWNFLCQRCPGPGLNASLRAAGAGVYCESASLSIKNSTITLNGSTPNVQPLVIGLGIASIESFLEISNCLIYRNEGSMIPGPNLGVRDAQIAGAGVACLGGSTALSSCRIFRNRIIVNDVPLSLSANRIGLGGGVFAGGRMTLDRCSLLENRIDTWGSESLAIAAGGALFCDGIVSMNTCIIGNNRCAANGSPAHTIAGGGVYNEGSLTIDACTFATNSAGYDREGDGHGIYCATGTTALVNSIVWDGTGGIEGDCLTVTYSDVQNGFPGVGNIDDDPQFVDAVNEGFHLGLGSPCIDSGTTTGLVEDLDRAPRPIDVLGVGQDGPSAFDMGCYEFQLKKSDMNHDGKVDAEDLLMFQEDWMREGGEDVSQE